MTTALKTAQEAFLEVGSKPRNLSASATAFVCPYPDCRVYALHYWGFLDRINVVVGASHYNGRILEDSSLYAALCSSCEREALFLDGKLIKPAASQAPAPAVDMPSSIIDEYAEAAAILPGSPRGSAALLRLAVQKLLPELGAKKRDINEQIAELVATDAISGRVQQALDTLRVVGNEAVHPGTIDLRDDVETAMGLFRLINFIIEKAISEPKHADEMFAKLPQGKRDHIEQRNARAVADATAKQSPSDAPKG